MFREVDVRDADIFKAGQAAVLMLNNALHYFTAEGVTALLANASQLLVPGGLLVVSIPFYLEETRTAPPESAAFSLHMMLNAQYGELHPIRWVENEMKRLGLTVVHESLAEETGDRFSLLIGTGQIT
jgi:trans-aconitate methyltransferase